MKKFLLLLSVITLSGIASPAQNLPASALGTVRYDVN